MVGLTPTFSAYSRIRSSSVYFSTTAMMRRPIFCASIAISMKSASLKPLQMIGVSLSASATTASNSGLERFVDVLEPMLQDVAKPDQRRQTHAAEPQIVDQLLEVDRSAGVLGRVDLDLAVLADREVSLPPSGDLVQLGGVGGGP